jgi:hypothetical protein
VVGHNVLVRAAPNPGGVTNIATLSASDLRSDAQVKLLCAKASQMLVKMKQVCEDQHLQFVGPTEFVPTEGRIYEFGWEDDVGPRIELNSADSQFQFWQKTNQIALFSNRTLGPLLYGKDAPHFDKPDTPKLSEKQAMQIATAFLSVLDVPSGIKLGNPHAEFSPQMDLPNYLLGQWDIRWPRFDNKNHIISSDAGVSMTISEGYGPEVLAAGLNVPYTEQSGEPMSQSDAIAKARSVIASCRGGLTFTLIPTDRSIIDDKLLSSELAIVSASPNRSWFHWWGKSVHVERLAWVFWFDPIFKNVSSGPTYDHRFMVSIDAYNGELIGTDAML